ncbi:MAG: hypothetical protein AB7L92_07370 [Alphaproteobacteria bacterium]
MSWKKELLQRAPLDTEVKVRIPRNPPRTTNNGDVVVQYHETVDELERVYSDMVREAEGNREALELSLDGYDPHVEELVGRIAKQHGLTLADGSAVGGVVQEHQDALRKAAIEELDRVEKAKKDRADLDNLDRDGWKL